MGAASCLWNSPELQDEFIAMTFPLTLPSDRTLLSTSHQKISFWRIALSTKDFPTKSREKDFPTKSREGRDLGSGWSSVAGICLAYLACLAIQKLGLVGHAYDLSPREVAEEDHKFKVVLGY